MMLVIIAGGGYMHTCKLSGHIKAGYVLSKIGTNGNSVS